MQDSPPSETGNISAYGWQLYSRLGSIIYLGLSEEFRKKEKEGNRKNLLLPRDQIIIIIDRARARVSALIDVNRSLGLRLVKR